MNDAVDSLLCATGTVQRAKAEIELLQQVELARKFMIAILWGSTDRSSLQEIFGGDLARVCRVRAVLEQLQLEKLATGSQRLSQCLLACQSIQDMLADLGFANALRKMQEEQSKAMASRFAGKPEDNVATVEKKPDSPVAEPEGESKELERTEITERIFRLVRMLQPRRRMSSRPWPTALEVLIFWWTQSWPKTPMNHMERHQTMGRRGEAFHLCLPRSPISALG